MVILEGTDAVGKTSVIKLLKEYKLKDRDKNICKLFDFNISLLERVIKLKKYLDNNNNYVIILINNDRNELEKRISLRENIDDYDRYTYLYNLLYLETFIYMEENNMLNGKLFMIDCTNISLEEETAKVKEIVDKIL